MAAELPWIPAGSLCSHETRQPELPIMVEANSPSLGWLMVNGANTCTLGHCFEEPADSALPKGLIWFAADAIDVEICHSESFI